MSYILYIALALLVPVLCVERPVRHKPQQWRLKPQVDLTSSVKIAKLISQLAKAETQHGIDMDYFGDSEERIEHNTRSVDRRSDTEDRFYSPKDRVRLIYVSNPEVLEEYKKKLKKIRVERGSYSASETAEEEGISYKDILQFLVQVDARLREREGQFNFVFQVLQTGALQAVEECQHQFRHSRWNCSTVENSTDIFGGVLKFKSREAAFVHALSSAALAHAVARACSRGELNECSCDARVRKRTPRHWQWGGCSEDIRYGEIYSRDFVDSKEDKNTDEGLMNLHNNEAGRRAVRGRMQRVCKCHGMSGSCSVRVCWRRLPQLRAVGDALTTRYEGASHVKVVERKRGKNIRKLRPLHTDMKKPNKTDLVYLEDSPDYCEPNDELGILGTRGRSCNRTSAGLDGCRMLCCGRGYQTRVRDHEEKCRCRFVWCCRVHCELCRYKRDHHVCN